MLINISFHVKKLGYSITSFQPLLLVVKCGFCFFIGISINCDLKYENKSKI